jgi:hypothetical protein
MHVPVDTQKSRNIPFGQAVGKVEDYFRRETDKLHFSCFVISSINIHIHEASLEAGFEQHKRSTPSTEHGRTGTAGP